MSKVITYDIGGTIIRVYPPQPDRPGYRASRVGAPWIPGTYDSVEAALMGAVCHAAHAELFVEELVNDEPISAQTIQSWIDGLIERATE